MEIIQIRPNKRRVEVPSISSKAVSKIFDIKHDIFADIPKASDVPEPDLVKAIYIDDFNIIKVHEAIITAFSSRLWKKRNDPSEIEIEIARYNNYINSAVHLLREYLPLASKQTKGIVTISAKKQEIENQSLISKRLQIVDSYIKIAAKYIKMDVLWNGNIAVTCPCCGADFASMQVDEDYGVHYCDCGYTRECISKLTNYEDASRVSATTQDGYDDFETFERGVQRYEGTYPEKIPDNLYNKLDEYFRLKGFTSRSDILALPHNRRGRKKGTTVVLLCEALGEIGYTNYYNSYNIIGHNYWGWKLPQLSPIRNAIYQDYEDTQKVYERIKTRDSSLNVNIRIYLHLKAKDWDCEWDDFKVLTSRGSLEYHQQMWKIMCTETGLKYTSII